MLKKSLPHLFLLFLCFLTLLASKAADVPNFYVRSATPPTGEDTLKVWIRTTDYASFTWDSSEGKWFAIENRMMWHNRNAVNHTGYLRFGQNIDPAGATTSLGYFMDRNMRWELAWSNAQINTMGSGTTIELKDRGATEVTLNWDTEKQVWDDLNWDTSSGDVLQINIVAGGGTPDNPDLPTIWLLGREVVTP